MILRAMLAEAYATGSTSHARQVKGDDPDKKGYSGAPDCGLGMRLTNPPSKKNSYQTFKKKKNQRRPRPIQSCRANDDDNDTCYMH